MTTKKNNISRGISNGTSVSLRITKITGTDVSGSFAYGDESYTAISKGVKGKKALEQIEKSQKGNAPVRAIITGSLADGTYLVKIL